MRPHAAPDKLHAILGVNLEQQHAIAVSYAASLIMNKPFAAPYSREDEASAGQTSVNHDIRDLIFLPGIGQCKRGFTRNLGNAPFTLAGIASVLVTSMNRPSRMCSFSAGDKCL
jgi:hypothetical protein